MAPFLKLNKFIKNAFIRTPLAMAKDMVTFAGIFTGKDEPYTVTMLKKIQDEQ